LLIKVAAQSRRGRWLAESAQTHLGLIDDDLDENDRRFAELNTKLDGMKMILIGILITLTTGSILLTANLAFR
jgi:hypothetical protein